MMKLQATYWDSNTRSNKVVIVEVSQSALESVRGRVGDDTTTKDELVDLLIDELTRPMLGRKVHRIERIQ